MTRQVHLKCFFTAWRSTMSDILSTNLINSYNSFLTINVIKCTIIIIARTQMNNILKARSNLPKGTRNLALAVANQSV